MGHLGGLDKVFKIWDRQGGGGGPRGILGNFGELFFGELQKTRGTFPKFPKIPQNSPKKFKFFGELYLLFSFLLYSYTYYPLYLQRSHLFD